MHLSTLRSSGLAVALMTLVLAGCSSESYRDRDAGGGPPNRSALNAPGDPAHATTYVDTTSDPKASARRRSTSSGSG